ncbi:branched-chain amino acid ABC transporter permease [Synechococcus elongatus IITB4]|uniref:branched-chain amino acid ABC transporter permease n=1 Tax=Synechococcus elongatus TaxID=32046 RepID=UPI0030CEDDC7
MIGYTILLVCTIALFALFCVGLNLHWGYTGLLNFGHVAFLLIGAYSVALLSQQGWPLWLAAIAGVSLSALLGLVMGVASLRLSQDYLGIVTVGLAEVLRIFVQNETGLTQGSFGVQAYPIVLQGWEPQTWQTGFLVLGLIAIAALGYQQLWQWWRSSASRGRHWLAIVALFSSLIVLPPALLGLADYERYPRSGQMLLLLAALWITVAAVERLVRSPWGRVLKAIREDEEVAIALGKNVLAYKLQSLALGGAIAGLAGVFYAWQLTAIYPDNFRPQLTFDAWTMLVLGGTAHRFGPVLGAVVFWLYDSLTRFLLPALLPLDGAQIGAFRIALVGLLLMALMIWRPQGILGRREELSLGR